MDSSTVVCREPAALWRRLFDGVLVRSPSGEFHELAGAAQTIWDLVADPMAVGEVVKLATARGHHNLSATDEVATRVVGELISLGVLAELTQRWG